MPFRKTYKWVLAIRKDGSELKTPYLGRVKLEDVFAMDTMYDFTILQKYVNTFELWDLRDPSKGPKFFDDLKAAKMAARFLR